MFHTAHKSFASSGFVLSNCFHCSYALIATSLVASQGAVFSQRFAISFAELLSDFGTNVCIPLPTALPKRSFAAPSNCHKFLVVLLSHIFIVSFLFMFSALSWKSPKVFRINPSSFGMFLTHCTICDPISHACCVIAPINHFSPDGVGSVGNQFCCRALFNKSYRDDSEYHCVFSLSKKDLSLFVRPPVFVMDVSIFGSILVWIKYAERVINILDIFSVFCFPCWIKHIQNCCSSVLWFLL